MDRFVIFFWSSGAVFLIFPVFMATRCIICFKMIIMFAERTRPPRQLLKIRNKTIKKNRNTKQNQRKSMKTNRGKKRNPKQEQNSKFLLWACGNLWIAPFTGKSEKNQLVINHDFNHPYQVQSAVQTFFLLGFVIYSLLLSPAPFST